MTAENVLREHLLWLLRGGQAHLGFDQAIAEFPLENINTLFPGGSYTSWHLLEHIRIAQWDILEFVRNPNHVSPAWPQEYWPAQDVRADKMQWEKTVAGFRADLKSLQDIVADPNTDLTAPLPHAPDYTILREVLLVADHNAYHIGEFAIMRQAMGTWPANSRRP